MVWFFTICGSNKRYSAHAYLMDHIRMRDTCVGNSFDLVKNYSASYFVVNVPSCGIYILLPASRAN